MARHLWLWACPCGPHFVHELSLTAPPCSSHTDHQALSDNPASSALFSPSDDYRVLSSCLMLQSITFLILQSIRFTLSSRWDNWSGVEVKGNWQPATGLDQHLVWPLSFFILFLEGRLAGGLDQGWNGPHRRPSALLLFCFLVGQTLDWTMQKCHANWSKFGLGCAKAKLVLQAAD